MLGYRVKSTDALKRLRTDKDGVVSFEQGVGCGRFDEEAVVRPSDTVATHDVVDRRRAALGHEVGEPNARNVGAEDEVSGDTVVVPALE